MSGHRKSSRKAVRLMRVGDLAGFEDQVTRKRRFKSPPVKADVTRGRIYPKRSIPEALFVDVATSLGYKVRTTGSGIHVQLEPNADIQKVFLRIARAINERL